MITITEQVTARPGKLLGAVAEATSAWQRKHPGVDINYIAVGFGQADEATLAQLMAGGLVVEQLRHLGGRVAVGHRRKETSQDSLGEKEETDGQMGT